jgi:hypothetical protein
LWLLTRYVTPGEIRTAGRRRIVTHLGKLKNIKNTIITTITDAALEAAHAQQIAVPGEKVAAELIRGLAHEMLTARDQLAVIDKHIAGVLERHPDAALIRSLPGMGATLTADAGLLPIRVYRRRLRPDQQGLLRTQTCRRQEPPASRYRPRPSPRQRAARDHAHPTALRPPQPPRRLTRRLGSGHGADRGLALTMSPRSP